MLGRPGEQATSLNHRGKAQTINKVHEAPIGRIFSVLFSQAGGFTFITIGPDIPVVSIKEVRQEKWKFRNFEYTALEQLQEKVRLKWDLCGLEPLG